MKRRLTKSSNNKVISGVLGGIADYFGIDPTIVRVVYVILSVLSQAFPGVLVYICLAIIMPDGKKDVRSRDMDTKMTIIKRTTHLDAQNGKMPKK